MTRAGRGLTPEQIARIDAAVLALPPMDEAALTRIAVLFASLDAQRRRSGRAASSEDQDAPGTAA